MLKLIRMSLFVFLANSSLAQWQWTELSNMPFESANNALCEAIVGGQEFVYSFGGIDPTKLYSGIHQRAAKYTVATDTWVEIDSLPDTIGKIAAGASFVKDKIYIMGGYHVFSNNTEISSDKVHVYNPTTDTYEADGASIPLAIDDHVQCVYKDSLIYVITGWSNTGNVPNVQIYDPSFDSWQVGTSTPSTFRFETFGASGYILGDTIYYYGGAAGSNFSARRFMRRGYINPLNPTDIVWTEIDSSPGNAGYRSACSGDGNVVFWVGGSPTSYNFNGIAYDGSGGVNPSLRILEFNNTAYEYNDDIPQTNSLMDLRGIAKLAERRWIIAGGMDVNQIVSKRTFLLENPSLNLFENDPKVFLVKYQDGQVVIESAYKSTAKLTDVAGTMVAEYKENEIFYISKNVHSTGVYLFVQGANSIRIQL